MTTVLMMRRIRMMLGMMSIMTWTKKDDDSNDAGDDIYSDIDEYHIFMIMIMKTLPVMIMSLQGWMASLGSVWKMTVSMDLVKYILGFNAPTAYNSGSLFKIYE